MIKNNLELVNEAIHISKLKTVYMWGTFGQKVTTRLISDKSHQYKRWYNERKQLHFKSLVNRDYSAFDCIGLIKGILWGWEFGNAPYNKNGVPDVTANTFITKCNNVSSDFKNIQEGEVVWMKGHIGIYIGNGKVVEATPKWDNGVQEVRLSARKWLKHGEIPYIEYISEPELKYPDLLVEDQWKGEAVDHMVTLGIVDKYRDPTKLIDFGTVCELIRKTLLKGVK